MEAVLTVRQLTAQLRSVVEGHFPFVWVRGEVTNLSRPASGHIYFSLKDSDAQLSCVWFRQRHQAQQTFDPLTGEVFEDGPRASLAHTLRNGQTVCCAGGIGVYAPRGAYQLVVELVQESGEGQLAALFEKLKQNLKNRGFFSQERKRPLPVCPCRVAVITAPSGAAVQDFIRLAATRGHGAELRIYSALMQGETAAQDIMRAMDCAVTDAWAQVLVLIRGGGSLEDLWAFNDASLAEAVLTSPLPVLAGIGHEVDFTLADLTADVRASTPSHAAQLLWPSKKELEGIVQTATTRLQRALEAQLVEYGRLLTHMTSLLHSASPEQRLHHEVEILARLSWMLRMTEHTFLDRQMAVLDRMMVAMRANSPCSMLEKALFSSVALGIRLQEVGLALLARNEERQKILAMALHRAMDTYLSRAAYSLEILTVRMESCAPEGPLRRGYALLMTETGHVLTSVTAVSSGEDLLVRLYDGAVSVTVRTSHPSNKGS